MNKLYLEQNKLEVIEKTEGVITTKLFGVYYNLYLDVKCSCCGAPLLAVKEESEIVHSVPWTGCSNMFCEDYIINLI